MSVGSSTDSGTTGARSRRARFREWRHDRPFAGGLLLCLAGLLIAWVPLQFAFELLLVGGSYTYVGLLWAVGVFLCGAFVLYRPDLSTIFGVLGVALSILSLLGALGGLLLGMIVGIIGGNLCIAWQHPDAVREGGGGGSDDDRPVRADGGSPADRYDPADAGESASRLSSLAVSLAATGPLSRLRSDGEASGAAPWGDYLDRARRFVRRTVPDFPASPPGAAPRAAPGRLVDAATSGGASKRLAVTVAVLVVASGTLTMVTAIPAAAILGDQEETTYTVDVGEIRLGENGRICAASVGSDAYRVTITNATLVDTTIYQQRGDQAVKTDFPSVEVDDTIVMYTRGGGRQLELLATSAGCTDRDQTSRTVFRNRYQIGELLRASEGVTMQNLEVTDATVPEPGGFRFAAPADGNGSSPVPNATDVTDVANATNVTDVVNATAVTDVANATNVTDISNATNVTDITNATNVTDVANATGVAEDVDDVYDDGLVDRLNNGSGDVDPVGETVGDAGGTVENATGGATNATGDVVSSAAESVENTTGEVTEAEPPENASGAVDGTTDAVDNTTGEATGTVDDAADAVDETVNATGDATNASGDVTGTVDETTDAVDNTTDAVDNTTDEVTDGVDGAAETVEGATTATATPTDDGVSSTTTATPDGGADRPAWLDQVDDPEAVMRTIEETEGGVDDVSNVTSRAETLDEETIAADENLTRLDNGTILLLNGTDPADVAWAADLVEEPNASTVGTETVTTTPEETESDDGSTLSGAFG